MNAPFALTREAVRTADLSQPDEAARIEGYVAAMAGSVFHRPAWLRAVEQGTGQRARGLVAEKGGAITGWLPLREEPQVLITPQAMPFENVHLAIQQHPFIRYDRNQWGGQLVDRYLRQHRLKVREWLELDALDAIAALVNRGLGVAIVPDWAPPWPGGLKLRKHILDDAEMRVTGVLWNKSGAQIAGTRAFVNSCTGH